MPTTHCLIPGRRLLELLRLDADVLVYAEPIPERGARVGAPVPLLDRSPKPPVYRILGVDYPAVALLRTIKTGDPSFIDKKRADVHALAAGAVSARDLAMLALAEEGRTYAEIGALHGGLKRQRVKQILDRLHALGYGHVKPYQIRAKRKADLVDSARGLQLRHVENAANPEEALAVTMVLRTRARAAAKGIAHTLTPADLLPLPRTCPALGIVLDYDASQGGGANDNYASVDRIVPEKGYVNGNVVVVSQRANRIKNDAHPEELRRIAEFYTQFTTKYA